MRRNSGGASSHAPPTIPETGGSALFSPSLLFPTGGDIPSPATPEIHAQHNRFQFLSFLIYFAPLPPLLDLQICPLFLSSPLLLQAKVQAEVRLVWDGDGRGGAGEGRRCCTGSGSALLWSWRAGGWRREQLRGEDDKDRGGCWFFGEDGWFGWPVVEVPAAVG